MVTKEIFIARNFFPKVGRFENVKVIIFKAQLYILVIKLDILRFTWLK